MKQFIHFFTTTLLLLLLSLTPSSSYAQCAIGVGPTFTSGCTSQYFTSITASGTGVVSTISYTAASCIGTFYDNFLTQGITAPTGSTVNINVGRSTGYLAYLAVYVDWNNNGTYETTELVGTTMTLATATSTAVYSFTIPLIGIVTNTPLHMRVFVGEPPTAGGALSTINPPCSARWGEAVDYFLNSTCTNPTITCTPSSPSVCGPTGSILLTASGAGGTPTYNWSPSAGLSTTLGAVTTATPVTTSTYTITGYGPGVCLGTGPVTVTVNPIPVPVINPTGALSVCPGGSINLSEVSGTGISYQWFRGGTSIFGATNSTYSASPTVATVYSVSVTSAAGCTGTAGVSVGITAPPVATVFPAGPITLCSPATQVLTANFLPGLTYQWLDAGGIIPGANSRTYTVTATGNYKVEITTAGGCKDTSAYVSVTIQAAPTATVTASGPLTFCFLNSVVLTAGTVAGCTYQWLDGTTIIPGATNITYVATTVGLHNYRVKVTNGLGCSDTSASGLFIVNVLPLPVSTITASGPTTFCVGNNVTLNTVLVAGNTYQWYSGPTISTAIAIPGATNSSYTTNSAGYYYVSVTSAAGCSSNSYFTPAIVSVIGIAQIIHTGLNICWGSYVNLSLGISASTTGITYQWLLNGVNISGATSSTYNADVTGSYTCHISVAGCNQTTLPVSVKVNPLPNPVITYGGGYLMTATYYSSYQWYKSLVPISGANSWRIMPTVKADYSVIVRDTNNCLSQATIYRLDTIILGTNDVITKNLPIIYPNPTTGKIFINYNSNLHIQVSGIDGKQLLEYPSAKQIDMSLLPSGTYLIALYDEEGGWLLTQKVIKE